MGDQALAADALLGEEALQLAGGDVAADDTEDFGGGAEGGEVARHIGRTAGNVTLADHVHDGHGGFRGNAADVAPDEMVEHDIADDEGAGLGGHRQDLAHAGGGEGFLRFHAGRERRELTLKSERNERLNPSSPALSPLGRGEGEGD